MPTKLFPLQALAAVGLLSHYVWASTTAGCNVTAVLWDGGISGKDGYSPGAALDQTVDFLVCSSAQQGNSCQFPPKTYTIPVQPTIFVTNSNNESTQYPSITDYYILDSSADTADQAAMISAVQPQIPSNLPYKNILTAVNATAELTSTPSTWAVYVGNNATLSFRPSVQFITGTVSGCQNQTMDGSEIIIFIPTYQSGDSSQLAGEFNISISQKNTTKTNGAGLMMPSTMGFQSLLSLAAGILLMFMF